MKTALLSDIHSNLEALEKAVSHASSAGADRFIVLGDTIGYGANPNECFEWVIENSSVTLIGNHEKALTDIGMRLYFNPMAARAIEWTAERMDARFIAQAVKLEFTAVEKDVTFVHSSPEKPEEFSYLMNYEDAVSAFEKMNTRICFIGHTHIPGCFCEINRSAEKLKPGIFKIPKTGKVILNPGSVGQPRDNDPRLSFAIYDDEAATFEVIRLEYDNQKAAEKIIKAGLPAYLADRLL